LLYDNHEENRRSDSDNTLLTQSQTETHCHSVEFDDTDCDNCEGYDYDRSADDRGDDDRGVVYSYNTATSLNVRVAQISGA
jgi:methionyl-tRNA synthetase